MLNIYITDLAAYNAGHLIGEFISLPKDEEELIEDINRILGKGERICKTFPHEEIFISDYEWEEMEIFPIEEFEDIHKLNKKLEFLQTYFEEEDHAKIKFLLENSFATSVQECLEKLSWVNFYPDLNMREFAEEYIENCYNLDNLPDIIRFHIYYEGVARDLEIDGSFFQEKEGVFEYLG